MRPGLNWQVALLSLFLAFIAWYFVSGCEKVDAWLELPVQISGMSEEFIIRDRLLTRVDVRVRGPKGLVRGLDLKTLAYSLNLSGLKVGFNVVQLSAQGVTLPKTFEVVEFTPPRLQLVVDRKESKMVPVVPIWGGNIDPDYMLLESRVTPEVVEVKGPEKAVREIVNVETQAIVINSSRPGLIEEQVSLSLPDEVESNVHSVAIWLAFGLKTRDLAFRLPVELPDIGGYNVRVEPEYVKIVVKMPLPLARDLEVGLKIAARILLPVVMMAGQYELPVAVALPTGCQQLSLEPAKVQLIIEEKLSPSVGG
ncbi:conserved hypothetical protein [Desulfovibrionales bacterium]